MQLMNSEELKFLEVRMQESKKILLLMCGVMGIGFVIVSYIIFFHLQLNESNQYLKLIPILVLILDITVLYFAMYLPFQNLTEDLQGKKKEVLTSQIERVEERQNKNVVRYYWILKNSWKVSVEASQYIAYKPGEDLIFHIAPKSKILLSVEK